MESERYGTRMYDLIAEKYDEIWGLPPKVMNEAVRALAEVLKEYNTILDIGTGTGRFAKPLEDLGFKVVGMDTSRAMLRKASEKGVRNLVKGDVYNFPFKDSSFDAAISILLPSFIEWITVLDQVVTVIKHVLVSVVHECPLDPVRKAYAELTRCYYAPIKQERRRRKLQEIVEPTRIIQAFSHSDEIPSNKILSLVNKKTFPWKVPDIIHERVMSELRDKFTGKIQRHFSVDLLIWDVNDLKSYIK